MMRQSIFGSHTADQWVGLMALAIAPPIMTLVFSLPFIVIGAHNHPITLLFQMLATMGAAFVAMPYLISKKLYGIELSDLGIYRNSLKACICAFLALAALYLYALSFDNSLAPIVYLSLKTFIVSICEEFWARGILICHLKKFTKNSMAVIFLATAVFTFVVHMNQPALENLLYRFPGALVITLVYWKSKRLSASVIAHFIYNMLSSV